jgi:hypothetical protein
MNTTLTQTPDNGGGKRFSARKVLAGALVAGVATLGLGLTTAHAQEPDQTDRSARIEQACARIPNAQARLDNAVARINGGADVRGSLLWLDTKIQAATDAGRTDLATALTNRRAVRVATLDVIELRRQNLAQFAELCAARS